MLMNYIFILVDTQEDPEKCNDLPQITNKRFL
jgi:hypothetical protein